MDDTLIYDAVTMSTATLGAGTLTLGLAGVAALLWSWKRWRGRKADVLDRWFAIAALIFAAVTGGLHLEKQAIAAHPNVQEVQGTLQGLWQDRVRRQAGQHSYWEWQGFAVSGVPFSYVRNSDEHYFNNAGRHQVALEEGMLLRIRYIEEKDGDRQRRHIVRIERVR